GGGADIWGTSDAFNFVEQAVTGDVDVRARVVAVQQTRAWAKAGVMIRTSLAADAADAMAVVTPTQGVAFQRRAASGAPTWYTPGPDVTAPYCVRLVRSGTMFTAYASSDGLAWQAIGTESIPMGDTVYVGLVVTSHDDGLLWKA